MQITPTNNEKIFKDNLLLVTKTDLKGHITYANRAFMDIVEMSEDTLIGAPHKIIRHPDTPKIIFKYLWNYIQSGKEIHAYVKNICADGSYYWVIANVTPSFDSTSASTNNIIGFHSARHTPTPEAMAIIKPLYETLLRAEKSAGITASEKVMNDLLQEKGVSYDEFILSF